LWLSELNWRIKAVLRVYKEDEPESHSHDVKAGRTLQKLKKKKQLRQNRMSTPFKTEKT